jgi:hypothetical protein
LSAPRPSAILPAVLLMISLSVRPSAGPVAGASTKPAPDEEELGVFRPV